MAHNIQTKIKKIMQHDDEVGKVPVATTVCVSKALELFIDLLLTSCVKEANEANSTKISPAFVKKAVMAEEKFDFLAELVETISDATEKPKQTRKRKVKDEDSPEKVKQPRKTRTTKPKPVYEEEQE